MSRHFRNIIFSLLSCSGIPFLFRELAQRHKVTIVVYHALNADRARNHFQALLARYHVIALADYLRARLEGAVDRLPPKSLVLTFDDGCRSNFELKPLLEKWKLPITIFLCSGVVGTDRHFWWFHAGSDRELEACKRMADSERLTFLLDRDYRPDQEYAEPQALSRDEIQELRPWVDFQAHTVTHPILPACSDEKAEREIMDSKTDLEAQHQLKIHALAFPNGDYSEREISLARKAGYRCALTLDCGFNDESTDLFRLRRIPLPDDASVCEVLVKTSGLWDVFRFVGIALKRFAARCGSDQVGDVTPSYTAKVDLSEKSSA